MDNNKSLNIKGVILSNILCEKEKELKKRDKPHYGVALMVVTHVDQRPLEPSQNRNPNFNNQRLVVDLLYLTDSNDLANNQVMALTPNQKINLMADPFTLFTKPKRLIYKENGYKNYIYKLWANNTKDLKLTLPNPKSSHPKLKTAQQRNNLLPERFTSFLEEFKYLQQNKIWFSSPSKPSTKVIKRLETSLFKVISS